MTCARLAVRHNRECNFHIAFLFVLYVFVAKLSEAFRENAPVSAVDYEKEDGILICGNCGTPRRKRQNVKITVAAVAV